MNNLRREVASIHELQRWLLPREPPQPPGWHVAVYHEAGAWPGGDYYDFLPLADGRLLFLIGDASDEGAPASVLGAIVRAVLHSCPLTCGVDRLPFCPVSEAVVQPPHLILANLHRVLWENSLEEQYLTAFCGILNPAEGSLQYANAGHPAPRCWRSATGRIEPLRDRSGLPLGLIEHSTYHRKHTNLAPGDLLLCYSDGLTAAQNPDGQAFRLARLDETLSQYASQGAEAVKRGLIQALEDFVGGQPLADDVTLVILERRY